MDPADLMGPMGPVTLEIVVPARNGARRLPGGLAALCQKAAGQPLSAAILAVDSVSTDGTSDVVRGDPRQPVPVRLLRCERPGKGVAVRVGLLATQVPFVGFCDADMACRRRAACLGGGRSTNRMAALIRASVGAGTSRARRSGAWIVAGPDGDVLAEGRFWISSSPPGPPCASRPRRWRG